jgi:hypothetical protein
MNTKFSNISSEVVDQILPRRDALGTFGKGAAAAALSMPILAFINRAVAQSGSSVLDVLNFALTLEFLEESFFRQGLDNSGLIPAADRPVIDQLRKHEQQHIGFLRAAISGNGGTPVALTDNDFDFTAGGALNPFGNYPTFLAMVQGFEDTGVRAYKGQARNLLMAGQRTNPVLTAALRIHSVEARHASMIRRMRGEKGWVVGAGLQGLPAGLGFEAIYAGEDNVTHGGVNADAVSSVSRAAVEASFDEPLNRDQVLAIAGPFLA